MKKYGLVIIIGIIIYFCLLGYNYFLSNQQQEVITEFEKGLINKIFKQEDNSFEAEDFLSKQAESKRSSREIKDKAELLEDPFKAEMELNKAKDSVTEPEIEDKAAKIENSDNEKSLNIRLKGVVISKNPFASIDVGGKLEMIRIGDVVAGDYGDYTVVAINRDSITLKAKEEEKTISLESGGGDDYIK